LFFYSNEEGRNEINCPFPRTTRRKDGRKEEGRKEEGRKKEGKKEGKKERNKEIVLLRKRRTNAVINLCSVNSSLISKTIPKS